MNWTAVYTFVTKVLDCKDDLRKFILSLSIDTRIIDKLKKCARDFKLRNGSNILQVGTCNSEQRKRF